MTTKTESVEEKILRRIPWEVFGLSSVLAVGAVFIFTPLTGLIVFAGGVLSAVNFIWIREVLSKALVHGKTKGLKTTALAYGLRLLLILAVFFIIIFFFSKKIIAFAGGFSSIIMVILAEVVIAIPRLKTWKS